ncbi:MAG: hypothetical protein HKN18_11740 [Silicimonas sp.]|nr:hypothetical protein [Silicimonas sp.]
MTGLANYHNGLAAEDAVELHYKRAGIEIFEERWRGAGGEIDLIGRDSDGLVFVEVKRSKTFARAAESLSRRQLSRIMLSAEDYVERMFPGQLVNMRIDLAMVDTSGQIKVLQNISIL